MVCREHDDSARVCSKHVTLSKASRHVGYGVGKRRAIREVVHAALELPIGLVGAWGGVRAAANPRHAADRLARGIGPLMRRLGCRVDAAWCRWLGLAVTLACVGEIGAGFSHLLIAAGDPVNDIGFSAGTVGVLVPLAKAFRDGRTQVEADAQTGPRSP